MPGPLQTLLNRAPIPHTRRGGGSSLGFGGFGSGASTSRGDQLSQMEKASTLFSIIDLIATEVAAADWHLYFRGNRPEAEREEVFDHPALVVWDSPATSEGEVIYSQDEFIEACLAPETRVVTEDLRWVPCGDLQVGDRLLGFDEENNGPGRARKWRSSVVTATGRQMLPSSLVTLTDGTQIVASNQHPWLCSTTQGNVQRWIETRDLMPPSFSQWKNQPGRQGRRRIRAHSVVKLLDVWDHPRSYEAGYVAGMYDGEGTLSQSKSLRAPVLSIGQADNEALFELEAALDRMGFITKRHNREQAPGFYTLYISGGQPENLRLLGLVRPERLLAKWRELGADQLGGLRSKGSVEVVSVEPLGLREVVTLSTSTKTYVAEGYAMHNSQQHYELTGEMDIVLESRRVGSLQLITDMWPVRPDRLSPVKSRDKFIEGWMYVLGGEEIPLRLNQVIQDKRQNPLDPWRGLSPLSSLMLDIEGERAAAAYNRNFFVNGAAPGGVIQLDRDSPLSDPQWDEMLARWQQQHKGVSNAHRVAIMEMGKFVEAKVSQRDMEFVDLRRFSREAIMEAYRVSKANLGHVEDVNRANNEGQEVRLSTKVIVPRLERWKKLLNRKFLPKFGSIARGYEFDYDSPVPEDATDKRLQERADVLNAVALIKEGADWDETLAAFELPPIPRDRIPNGNGDGSQPLVEEINEEPGA